MAGIHQKYSFEALQRALWYGSFVHRDKLMESPGFDLIV